MCLSFEEHASLSAQSSNASTVKEMPISQRQQHLKQMSQQDKSAAATAGGGQHHQVQVHQQSEQQQQQQQQQGKLFSEDLPDDHLIFTPSLTTNFPFPPAPVCMTSVVTLTGKVVTLDCTSSSSTERIMGLRPGKPELLPSVLASH